MFTYLNDLLTKGGGLKTKSEALALYLCIGALGAFVVSFRKLKNVSIFHYVILVSKLTGCYKK